MNRTDALHARLDEIAAALAASGQALALLGLGSVGQEIARIDEWSDLDFFAIVKPGQKMAFIDNCAWLEAAVPLSWRFRNTGDGYKLLWADGIFGEMAVFEPAELPGIPYAPGRVIWSAPGFDTACLTPVNRGGQKWTPPSAEFARGELVSCLYVGLCRYRRGERLSAWRFIQGHCLDRFLELAEMAAPRESGWPDSYSRDRRFEARYPEYQDLLTSFLPGYASTPQAALAMLGWLEATGTVNPALAGEIRRLAGVVPGRP